jgi:hypothetical protein
MRAIVSNVQFPGICLSIKYQEKALALRLKNYLPFRWPGSLDAVVCGSPGEQRQEMSAIYRRYESFYQGRYLRFRVFLEKPTYTEDKIPGQGTGHAVGGSPCIFSARWGRRRHGWRRLDGTHR